MRFDWSILLHEFQQHVDYPALDSKPCHPCPKNCWLHWKVRLQNVLIGRKFWPKISWDLLPKCGLPEIFRTLITSCSWITSVDERSTIQITIQFYPGLEVLFLFFTENNYDCFGVKKAALNTNLTTPLTTYLKNSTTACKILNKYLNV